MLFGMRDLLRVDCCPMCVVYGLQFDVCRFMFVVPCVWGYVLLFIA